MQSSRTLRTSPLPEPRLLPGLHLAGRGQLTPPPVPGHRCLQLSPEGTAGRGKHITLITDGQPRGKEKPGPKWGWGEEQGPMGEPREPAKMPSYHKLFLKRIVLLEKSLTELQMLFLFPRRLSFPLFWCKSYCFASWGGGNFLMEGDVLKHACRASGKEAVGTSSSPKSWSGATTLRYWAADLVPEGWAGG